MPGSDSLRLFVAVYPPPEAARSLLAALAAPTIAASLPAHRRTPPEQVHLTLAFLGSVSKRHVAGVTESVERSCSGLPPFSLAPRRLITLPQGQPHRLAAVETDAPPPLLELVTRLTSRLLRNPRPRPADRFLPHLTLCRFNHPVGERPVRSSLDHPLVEPPFAIDRIRLMRSVLLPSGAEHREIAAFPLS
ncbi:MAG: RNA 2',3'-cyclic phosphodiesterase [Phycisphaeraceae bacterium]|nr:RNA 2',3'-cyclic phosphodiesterase [Phycisphaeraceae bacterium]